MRDCRAEWISQLAAARAMQPPSTRTPIPIKASSPSGASCGQSFPNRISITGAKPTVGKIGAAIMTTSKARSDMHRLIRRSNIAGSPPIRQKQPIP